MNLQMVVQFLMGNKKTFLTYLCVGLLTAFINLLSFFLISNFLATNYRVAITIAYVLAVIFHFMTNKLVTFKNISQKITQQILKYFVVLIINYLIIMVVVEFFVQILLLKPFIGLIFSLGFTAVFGYLMSKFWVFNTKVIA